MIHRNHSPRGEIERRDVQRPVSRSENPVNHGQIVAGGGLVHVRFPSLDIKSVL